VAVESARAVPVTGFVYGRHITGNATKRDDPSGVLRPNIILDGSRSGRETPRLPELFQQAPRSFGLKRTAARSRGCGCAVKLWFIPVAEALSRTLSDAYRRVISVIRQPHPRTLVRLHGLTGIANSSVFRNFVRGAFTSVLASLSVAFIV
jgi:hypothetical protein